MHGVLGNRSVSDRPLKQVEEGGGPLALHCDRHLCPP
jgi:hypothetical protein